MSIPHVQVPITLFELLENGYISKSEKLVWEAVKSYDWTSQGKGNGCTASIENIGKRAGLKEGQTRKCLKSLIEKKLLNMIEQDPANGRNTNTYFALDPVPGVHPIKGVHSDEGGGSLQYTPPCTPVQPGGFTPVQPGGFTPVHPKKNKREEYKREEDKEKNPVPLPISKFAGIGKTVSSRSARSAAMRALQREAERNQRYGYE